MGNYNSIIIQGIYEDEDLQKINEFLDNGMDRSYVPLSPMKINPLTYPEFGRYWYFGDYKYFNVWKFAEFLEKMDWKDTTPENHIALFVKFDHEFKYHEHDLRIPDQNWKNFGKE
jgi:hypothetical protein